MGSNYDQHNILNLYNVLNTANIDIKINLNTVKDLVLKLSYELPNRLKLRIASQEIKQHYKNL